MLKEITMTQDQFDRAFDEVLDHIKEAAADSGDPFMLLRIGSLAAVLSADLKHILFKEEKLEVKEESKDGN